MRTAEYDFFLPPGLIAERPAEERDISRLLVLHKNGDMEHRRFSDLPSYLAPGDLLILNDTKVFPARISARKPTGGKIDFLLVTRLPDGSWEVLSRERYTGELVIADRFSAQMALGKVVTFRGGTDLQKMIWEHGQMPLPPYIRRTPDEDDKQRYQTVYAEKEGSIAAPTAGLHFTPELLGVIRERSVDIHMVTLHVGTGTFRPVKTETVEDHIMDREYFEIGPSVIAAVEEARKNGRRVLTVGTTTTRTLEGYFSGRSSLLPANGKIRGTTDIFIHEGYRFRAADVLLTNFHLPQSTPLMLTAAFAGRKKLLNAYKEAISAGYRFFSYGDAMLVL
ncbi:MAG: tRNA preQ1(34) S-adenosylmethionine ribosyltransferase-isomerase QueA [Nitrospirae bacterium]|nr:tRNA preQ1(34) S-adenosylmethionine ribosyltransferase-isomerase QueA [Nitrospirota bacterium]